MSPFGKVGQLASTAAVGPEAAPATALCEQGTLLDTNDLEDPLKRGEIGGVSRVQRQSIGCGRGSNEQVREPSAV